MPPIFVECPPCNGGSLLLAGTTVVGSWGFDESLPDNKDSPKPQDPTTVVPDNSRDPPLHGGHSTKIGGMWNLKHEISSPKFHKLLIKTELQGDTDLGLNNFYNHIKIFFNAVTKLEEDRLSNYQYIKRHFEFE